MRKEQAHRTKASGAGSQTPARASFPAILSLRSPWLPFLSVGSGCWGNRGPNQKSKPWFAASAAARGVNAPPRPKSSHRLEVTGMTSLGRDGHVRLLLALAISARQCSPPVGAHILSLPHLRSVPGSPGSAPCSQAVSGVLRLGLPCPQGSSAFFPCPAVTCSRLPSRPQLQCPPPPLLSLLSSSPQAALNGHSVLHIWVTRQAWPLASQTSWQSGWTELTGR